MKHAGPDALAALAPLLAGLRQCAGLTEKRPGIFYRRGSAFLHFHEDAAGLFADVKLRGPGFERLAVDTPAQQRELLAQVRRALGAGEA